MRLRALAPAKVNLMLFVGARRESGRHALVTVYESLSLADVVEAETLEAGADEVICPGVKGENLAARALAGLRARGWGGPPLRLTIDKRIPVSAGMGGGSADAAAALRLAMAVVPGRAEEVAALAAELGADVPAQLQPGLSVGSGEGEIVEPFAPLPAHAFAVVPSAQRLATAAVYAEADRLAVHRSDAQLTSAYLYLLDELMAGGSLPRELIVNDLEAPAISLCPSIAEAMAALRQTRPAPAQVLVSGSGPTVVGVWWGEAAEAEAGAAVAALRERYPGTVAALPVQAEFAAVNVV